ncbi:MAG: aminotransferase class I/II-fold pyridoxal phosphate-dependent enzyme, partial [Selenomonadales bacterium]|nr:aminotransferase class I/II-fold pyridoxal phosphate-dependent enzyme [Selenomonadales bacterium]
MVSEKMYGLGTRKSTIRTIFEFGRKRAAEIGEENVYDFSIGNPNVPAPAIVNQTIIDTIKEMDSCALHGYTVAPGDPEVRETIAKSINRRFGTDYAGKNLFMTSGAAAALTICFKALAEDWDEFLTFAPYFPEYKCFVESVGSELKVVPANTDDFQIRFDMLEEMLTPHIK